MRPCSLTVTMTSELFRTLIQPRINARVLELVNHHLSDDQIGLLLVKMINPYAVLSQKEEALLRGVDPKTLRGMKSRGELADSPPPHPVNAKDSRKLPKSGPGFPENPIRRAGRQNLG